MVKYRIPRKAKKKFKRYALIPPSTKDVFKFRNLDLDLDFNINLSFKKNIKLDWSQCNSKINFGIVPLAGCGYSTIIAEHKKLD